VRGIRADLQPSSSSPPLCCAASPDNLVIMADFHPRPASAADVDALAELRAVVLRADLERLGRYDEDRVRQRLRDRFVPAYARVIEAEGTIGGCVSLRPAQDGHWLEHFYLTPHLQGSGIGTAVLRDLLEQCDRDGVVVRLNVLQGSPARRLYERHGFTVAAEDPVDVFMVRASGEQPVEVVGQNGQRGVAVALPAQNTGAQAVRQRQEPGRDHR
jgi:GNAT superfamily N-acetyltransferase